MSEVDEDELELLNIARDAIVARDAISGIAPTTYVSEIHGRELYVESPGGSFVVSVEREPRENTYTFTTSVDGLDLDDEFQNEGIENLPYGVVLSRTNGIHYADVTIKAATLEKARLRVRDDLLSFGINVLHIWRE